MKSHKWDWPVNHLYSSMKQSFILLKSTVTIALLSIEVVTENEQKLQNSIKKVYYCILCSFYYFYTIYIRHKHTHTYMYYRNYNNQKNNKRTLYLNNHLRVEIFIMRGLWSKKPEHLYSQACPVSDANTHTIGVSKTCSVRF